MDVHQQMDVVFFATKLQELAAPRRQAIPKRLFQVLQ
jgi:hypothetical protein